MASPEAAAYRHHASEPGDRPAPHQRARRQSSTMPVSLATKQCRTSEPGDKAAPSQQVRTKPASLVAKQYQASEPATDRRQASDGPGLFSPCAEDPGVVKWICYTTDGI